MNACQDMLVDIYQLHKNHLYTLDIQTNNSAYILTDFVKYSPAVASQSLIGMLIHVKMFKTELKMALTKLKCTDLCKFFPKMF